jgi:hypothetical protein
MTDNFGEIRIGLALVMLCLAFGIGMGVTFGINEDMYKDRIAEVVAANPQAHGDSDPSASIWRYAQRAHFHATGIAAFSIGLLLLLASADMKSGTRKVTSILIGLGGLYPLAWFNMYLVAPAIGRGPAHSHILTEVFTWVGVGGLVIGFLMLSGNLFLGLFRES